MYDPPRLHTTSTYKGAPFIRLVADVRNLAESTSSLLHGSGTVVMTKHLCGGATDRALIALCTEPLHFNVSACCFAPCCHEKTKRDEYCNLPFLESLGFCQTHVGVRGIVQDIDWKTFGMLISMSKGGLRDGGVTVGGEYKNSRLRQMLGIKRAEDLGFKVRRLLEEGRLRYLQQHGFEASLLKYCENTVTGDNLVIIARKKRTENCNI
jgi:tRNA:m4X modification enzyme